ncbi:MAG: alpha/beta hydrolase [Pseudomonadota bacterium]
MSDKWTQASDGTRLYYRDYAPLSGKDDAIPVVCLHGLTRSSLDFEDLAPRLAQRHRVICPDVRGRGRSGAAKDPNTYIPLQYIKDLKILLAEADISRCAIVGTSMGGILAMTMAGMARHSIAGVVLNDIGPDIDPKGLERIKGYVGLGGPVDTWDAAADAVKTINEDALPHYDEAQWLAMARKQYREEDGRVVPNYDANIRVPFEAGASAPAGSMWPFFEALIDLPLLIVRGETSDILNASTADKMVRVHGKADYCEVPGVGHAPMLDEPGVPERIAGFLAPIPAKRGLIGSIKDRWRSLKELKRIAAAVKQPSKA